MFNRGGASTALQQSVTRTLLKFCEDHQYPDDGLAEVRQCLKSLKRGDVSSAIQSYRKVPLGGRMGYFDEWIPPVRFSNETEDYVSTLFAVLVAQWREVMESIARLQSDEN